MNTDQIARNRALLAQKPRDDIHHAMGHSTDMRQGEPVNPRPAVQRAQQEEWREKQIKLAALRTTKLAIPANDDDFDAIEREFSLHIITVLLGFAAFVFICVTFIHFYITHPTTLCAIGQLVGLCNIK